MNGVAAAQEYHASAGRLQVLATNRTIAVQFVLHAHVLVVFGGADARVALGTVVRVNAESFPVPADIAERTVVTVKSTTARDTGYELGDGSVVAPEMTDITVVETHHFPTVLTTPCCFLRVIDRRQSHLNSKAVHARHVFHFISVH